MALLAGDRMNWLSRAFCGPDGIPSSGRILFALVVVYALGLVTGSLCVEMSITEKAQSIIETLIWATAAAVGFGKFAENKEVKNG